MGDVNWSSIVCLSGEARWSGVLQTVYPSAKPDSVFVVDVLPSASDPGAGDHELLKAEGRLSLKAMGLHPHPIYLEATHGQIVDLAMDIVHRLVGGKVILDISCMPKRIFLPLLRVLAESEQVTELIVAVCRPLSYSASVLAEDPGPPRSLPLFMEGSINPPDRSTLIASIGFEVLGLPQIIESDYWNLKDIKVLFPFPSAPPALARNWEVLRHLDRVRTLPSNNSVIGVDPMELPGLYSRLRALSEDLGADIVLAPFGPKVVTVAMGLLALAYPQARRPPVLYTQPRRYNPNYSIGIALRGGQPDILAYLLKRRGVILYA